MKIYVFTIRYRRINDLDWQFVNSYIESENVKDAINRARSKFLDKHPMCTEIVIDNIFVE